MWEFVALTAVILAKRHLLKDLPLFLQLQKGLLLHKILEVTVLCPYNDNKYLTYFPVIHIYSFFKEIYLYHSNFTFGLDAMDRCNDQDLTQYDLM